MKTRVIATGFVACVGLAIAFGRIQDSMLGEITANDHPIVRLLHTAGEISSSNEAFRGVDEVCIANEIDISELDRNGTRVCKTKGEALALVGNNSCKVISLEKLRVRVLLSENTFECRKTASGFRILIHKSSNSEFLDFD